PSRSTIDALISPTFSLTRTETSFLPLMMSSRASITHCGHNESVCRGKPSVGFVFCHDLRIGLSAHLGVNDGVGLNWFTLLIALNAAEATYVRPFSKCLMGLVMGNSLL